MSEDHLVPPAFESKAEELTYRIEGVEAAIQSAIRMDDQEWLSWLYHHSYELKEQLAQVEGK